MKNWKTILTYSLIIGLFSWLVVNLGVTLGFAPEPNPLWETHQELLVVENRMSEIKPLCNELESLRLQRDELVNKTDKIINNDFKESETTQTIEAVIPPTASPNVSVVESPVVEAWSEPMKEIKLTTFDIDKLAYAIAMAETGDCTKGMGVTKNNCFGLMTWHRGFREGRTYATKEESYADFKKVWEKSYGGFPTYGMAQTWTGNDHPDTWLANVKQYYYN